MSKRVTKDEQQELVLSDTLLPPDLLDRARGRRGEGGLLRRHGAVLDPDGQEFCRYRPPKYLEHIAEAVLRSRRPSTSASTRR
jgi:hypothetical protein